MDSSSTEFAQFALEIWSTMATKVVHALREEFFKVLLALVNANQMNFSIAKVIAILVATTKSFLMENVSALMDIP